VRRPALICGVALALLPTLVGCGGEDEPSVLPTGAASYAMYNAAPRIMADGFEATLALESVHLLSETHLEGEVTLMDLSLRRDGDCLGRLQLPDWPEPADFLVRDGVDYVRGSAELWGDRAEEYAGRWVTTGELAAYCDFRARLTPFTRPIDQELTSRDGESELGGQTVVRVSTPTQGGRLRAWVAAEEPHHVLRLELTGGRDTGTIDLSEFDEPVDVPAPPAGQVVALAPR
jgi:hypothetical protein